MMFTLEAVKARHGDSLLLRHGKPESPGLIVIDGGPPGVYGTANAPGPLRRRLLALRDERPKAGPLPIQLLMVSHIDDDHIGGVLELTRELADLALAVGSGRRGRVRHLDRSVAASLFERLRAIRRSARRTAGPVAPRLSDG